MHYVDGIAVSNMAQANVLADRLFERHNKSKTVIILNNDRIQVGERVSTKKPPPTDDATGELF